MQAPRPLVKCSGVRGNHILFSRLTINQTCLDMKKNLFTLLIALATVSVLPAQTDSSLTYKNVFSLNVNGVLSGIFDPSAYSGDQMITYRRVMKKINLRAGLGGRFTTQNSTGLNGYEGERENIFVSLRLGLEHTFFTYRKWSFYAGGDLVGMHQNGSQVETNAYSYSHYEQRYRTESVGIGVIGGIVCQINPRIGISLETGLDVLYEKWWSYSSTYNTNNGSYISDVTGNQIITRSQSPASINLRVSF